MANSFDDIVKFFWTKEDPVVLADFLEFWNSLSDEDKAHLKKADLSGIAKF